MKELHLYTTKNILDLKVFTYYSWHHEALTLVNSSITRIFNAQYQIRDQHHNNKLIDVGFCSSF